VGGNEVSRSNYSDDCDGAELNLWRGAVRSAINGKRGQALLREMLTALDAMPEKRLIATELEEESGEVCALGAVGRVRGVRMDALYPEDSEQVARAFGVADALVREIAFMNDEGGHWNETPEARWTRMRRWVQSQLAQDANRGKEAPDET